MTNIISLCILKIQTHLDIEEIEIVNSQIRYSKVCVNTLVLGWKQFMRVKKKELIWAKCKMFNGKTNL